MEDRRHNMRMRTLKAGTIVFNNRQSTFDCLVRNLSNTGACLQIDSSKDIPANFDLSLDGEIRPCRLVWLSENRAGIEFTFHKAARKSTSWGSLASPDEVRGNDPDNTDSATLRAALDL